MQRSLIALALAAGLVAGLMGGAQAQTISGSNGSGSAFNVSLSGTADFQPAFVYTYTAALQSISGGSVNSFDFNFQEPVQFLSATGGFTPSGGITTSQLFTFTSSTGLSNVGDSAVFKFYSPDAPNGYVGVAATAPGLAGGTSVRGPGPSCACPSVPEPASLALLGLGALPLGLIARRRPAGR